MVGGDQHCLQGDDRRRVGLDRSITGDFDESDRFDLTIREFRGDRRGPREDRSCGMFGVDRVALTR